MQFSLPLLLVQVWKCRFFFYHAISYCYAGTLSYYLKIQQCSYIKIFYAYWVLVCTNRNPVYTLITLLHFYICKKEYLLLLPSIHQYCRLISKIFYFNNIYNNYNKYLFYAKVRTKQHATEYKRIYLLHLLFR